jgi:chromosome partitioning protein
MHIITIANQKGGCAKTTTVVNLAACLADAGKKVLVVDLDPQSNASDWLCTNMVQFSSLDIFSGQKNIADLISQTTIANLSLIAGSQGLAQIEKILAGQLGLETFLRRRLAALPADAFDFVLIDTPPTLGLLTLNGLSAATELLIPVTTHVMTLSGVAQLINTINQVKDILNPDINILGFVASRVDLRTRHSKDVLESLRERFGEKVFNTVIRENVRLAEAPSFKESIIQYDAGSVAADDYRKLAQEIISRLSRKQKKS